MELASLMESSGSAMKIQITSSTKVIKFSNILFSKSSLKTHDEDNDDDDDENDNSSLRTFWKWRADNDNDDENDNDD